MTPLQFRDALFGAWDAYWAQRTPVAWPNVPYDPGAEVDAYVELQLAGNAEDGRVPTATSANAAGNHREQGTLGVSIYVRQGNGTDRAYELADDVTKFFEPAQARAVPATVFSRVSAPQPVGPDGAWWQLLVTATYTHFTDRG